MSHYLSDWPAGWNVWCQASPVQSDQRGAESGLHVRDHLRSPRVPIGQEHIHLHQYFPVTGETHSILVHSVTLLRLNSLHTHTHIYIYVYIYIEEQEADCLSPRLKKDGRCVGGYIDWQGW